MLVLEKKYDSEHTIYRPSLKQVQPIIEILPTGGRRTGDEDIRADIPGSRFVGQRCSSCVSSIVTG
jgi:hypothetical protein